MKFKLLPFCSKNFVIFFITAALVFVLFQNEIAYTLPETFLTIGKLKLTVEVADTPLFRARGLMFRKTLLPAHGMLFVFPKETRLTFWMKNTSIPLTIMFVNSKGYIIDIRDLVPFSEEPVASLLPAKYAIEVNRGLCNRYSIKSGMKVEGL